MKTPFIMPAAIIFCLLGLARPALGAGTYFQVDYPASTVQGELIVAVTYTLWIPDGVKNLRGVIVHQHGAGITASKEGSTAAYDLHWQALAKKWDCALLGPSYHVLNEGDLGKAGSAFWFDPRRGSDKAFQKCLVDFAAKAKHAELTAVPWVLWGHSAGAGWCDVMIALHPERVVGAFFRSGCSIVWRGRDYYPDFEYPKAAYDIPVMCVCGAKEKWVGEKLQKTFHEYRAKDAPIGYAHDPRTDHECGDSRYFAIPYLDACLAMRLPARPSRDEVPRGPQVLKPIDRSKAWLVPFLGDKATPAAQYDGKLEESVWLPNEAIAKAYMEYVKTGAVGDTTPPPAPTNVRALVKEKGTVITWDAEADFESGIRCFIILRDGKELAQVPKTPKGQFGRRLFQSMTYHDTPSKPLPEMRYLDETAKAAGNHEYKVITVNSVGLKSEPSARSVTILTYLIPKEQFDGDKGLLEHLKYLEQPKEQFDGDKLLEHLKQLKTDKSKSYQDLLEQLNADKSFQEILKVQAELEKAGVPVFTGEKSNWRDGFVRYDYVMDEKTLEIKPFKALEGEKFGIGGPPPGTRRCVVIAPKTPAEGNPWSWRGCYWDHQSQAEVELLRRGFHIAYISADAGRRPNKTWDAWYTFLTEKHGLSKKPAFIGMSRGGEFAYTWAVANPDKVSCIYADNPGGTRDLINKVPLLAQHDVPILHVNGSVDPILGKYSNVIEGIYHALGGRISVMVKDGAGHHPHSLRDSGPIADFIVQSCQEYSLSAHLLPYIEKPSFPPGGATKTSFYSIENIYRDFPKEGMYITCRGPAFTPCYDCYEFGIGGVEGPITVIVPKTVAQGKPWVYRAGFADRKNLVDLDLLGKGYHIVVGPSPYNADGPLLQHWNALYKHLVGHGFAQQPVLEGAGRAAGEVYAWAIENPDKVSCIYAENPVLKSHMSKKPLLENLALLTKAGVPILHVCGSLDPALKDQTLVVEKRYKELGGQIRVIIKEGDGHYPLTPRDRPPVVDFIIQSQRH